MKSFTGSKKRKHQSEIMAKTIPCQPNHGDSPLLESEQASSLTPGTTQPTNLNQEPEGLSTGARTIRDHYVTRSGRVGKPPSKMDI